MPTFFFFFFTLGASMFISSYKAGGGMPSPARDAPFSFQAARGLSVDPSDRGVKTRGVAELILPARGLRGGSRLAPARGGSLVPLSPRAPWRRRSTGAARAGRGRPARERSKRSPDIRLKSSSPSLIVFSSRRGTTDLSLAPSPSSSFKLLRSLVSVIGCGLIFLCFKRRITTTIRMLSRRGTITATTITVVLFPERKEASVKPTFPCTTYISKFTVLHNQ